MEFACMKTQPDNVKRFLANPGRSMRCRLTLGWFTWNCQYSLIRKSALAPDRLDSCAAIIVILTYRSIVYYLPGALLNISNGCFASLVYLVWSSLFCTTSTWPRILIQQELIVHPSDASRAPRLGFSRIWWPIHFSLLMWAQVYSEETREFIILLLCTETDVLKHWNIP